jgi:hypothetical protein
LISLIVSTQLYAWLNPIPFFGGQDLRLDISIFLGLIGPGYSLVTMNHSSSHWESMLNFYFSSQVYIPGPDPNKARFLTDEQFPDFTE